MNVVNDPENKNTLLGRANLPRRTVIGAAAWSVPVITVAAAAPAFAASGRAIVKTTPGVVGTEIPADGTTTTQQLSVQVTQNNAGVPGRAISFSVSALTGDSDVSWLTFSQAVTGANGVATTTLTYGTKAGGRKPTVASTYRVVALDSADPDLSVIWTLSYTPTRVTVFADNFNGIATALPAGFTVRTGATATVFPGAVAAYTAAATAWSVNTGNFRNVASANGLTSAATTGQQAASTNRAIAVKQSGSFGDPGAAFVVNLGPIGNHTDVKVSFRLQSLDTSAAVVRTTTWSVDGGSTPANRVLATITGATATSVTFKDDIVTADFGNKLDGISGDVFVRIVTLTATTGSGSRPTVGIDDLAVSWI